MTYRHSNLRAKLAKPIAWWRKIYATACWHVEQPITTREFKIFLAVPVGLLIAVHIYDLYLIHEIHKQVKANLAATERLVEETRDLNRSIDGLGESFDDMPRLVLDPERQRAYHEPWFGLDLDGGTP
jgi:hypothetical protein